MPKIAAMAEDVPSVTLIGTKVVLAKLMLRPIVAENVCRILLSL